MLGVWDMMEWKLGNVSWLTILKQRIWWWSFHFVPRFLREKQKKHVYICLNLDKRLVLHDLPYSAHRKTRLWQSRLRVEIAAEGACSCRNEIWFPSADSHRWLVEPHSEPLPLRWHRTNSKQTFSGYRYLPLKSKKKSMANSKMVDHRQMLD